MKAKASFWLLLALLFAKELAFSQISDVVYEEKTQQMWHKFVNINIHNAASEMIQKIATDFAAEKAIPIRRLVVGSDRRTVLQASELEYERDVPPEELINLRREQIKVPSFLMEIFCINKDCVQRQRLQTGELKERVLSGRNPLLIETSKCNARVKYIRLLPDKWEINFSVVISDLRLDNANMVLEILKERFADFDLAATLRSEPWFYESEVIPAGFSLWPERFPKNAREFSAKPFIICSNWRSSGTSGCREWSYPQER